jgi:asparagine synthase (glutamine-hydrolysing)
MGLSVPIEEWLRGPLRPWAEELLAPAAIERAGLLRAAPIRSAWAELLAGSRRQALGLWAVLVFQAWRGRWLP